MYIGVIAEPNERLRDLFQELWFLSEAVNS